VPPHPLQGYHRQIHRKLLEDSTTLWRVEGVGEADSGGGGYNAFAVGGASRAASLAEERNEGVSLFVCSLHGEQQCLYCLLEEPCLKCQRDVEEDEPFLLYKIRRNKKRFWVYGTVHQECAAKMTPKIPILSRPKFYE
jgi:hypothetical protein